MWSFDGDGVRRVGEFGKGGKGAKNVGSGVTEGITEFALGGLGTDKDVVAVGIERLPAVAVSADKSGGRRGRQRRRRRAKR